MSGNRGVSVFTILWAVLLAGVVGGTGVLQAAELQPGVARVSLIRGDVSSMRGDSGDWVAVTINTPLVRTDTVSTASASRAEIELDHANLLRVADDTEVRIADLSRTNVQLQLSRGLITLSVDGSNEADVEINTPNVAIRPLKEGVYRIEVKPNGETEFMVRKGEAEASTSQGSVVVKKNQMIMVRGDSDPEYQLAKAPGKDGWDRWVEERDDVIDRAQSWRYANRYYTGAHDLDRYGRWVRVDGYDWVWSPSVDPYWAPYRSGRWVWEPYFGWTWVSHEPWGWAPYHYGRWFHHANAWYWWPGPVHHYYRPIWAPAYVSFLGFGYGRFNFSFGFGWGYNRIGWLPIGPHDYYYPWWGHRNHYNHVNITNITNITNIRNVRNITNGESLAPLADGSRYRRPRMSNLDGLTNDQMRNSVTAVSTDDFVRGRTDRRSRIERSELQNGHLVAGTPPAVPTRESLRSVDREVTRASARNTGGQPSRFFSKREPPKISNSFADGTEGLRRMVERDVTSQPSSTIRDRDRESRGSAGGPSRATTNAGQPARNLGSGSGTAPNRAGESRRDTDVSNAVKPDQGGTSGPTRDRSSGRGSWNRFGRQNQTNPDSGTMEKSTPETRRTEPATPSRRTPGAGTRTPEERGPQSSVTPDNRNLGSSTPRFNEVERPRSEPSSEGWNRFSGGPERSSGQSERRVFRYDRGSGSGGSYSEQGDRRPLESPRQIGPERQAQPRRFEQPQSSRPSRNFESGSTESGPRSFGSGTERSVPRSFQTQPRNSQPSGGSDGPRRFEQPRSFERQRGGESPRSFQSTPRSYQSPQSVSPRYETPRRMETPRYDAPRRSEAPRSYQAPRSSSPSYQAPRSQGRSYSAPRSAPSGGGSSGGPQRGGGGGRERRR